MQLKWPMLWDLFSLFPAYAGVIPRRRRRAKRKAPFPRIRGGDPSLNDLHERREYFSPHTRG